MNTSKDVYNVGNWESCPRDIYDFNLSARLSYPTNDSCLSVTAREVLI